MTPSLTLTHERNDFVSEFKERHGRNLATHNEALDRIDVIEQAARETVALFKKYGADPDFMTDTAADMVRLMLDAETVEYDLIGAAVAVEVERGL